MTVNKVILIGRLGRDPEGRATAGGSKVVRLNVATDEVWSDQRGERQKRTEWHRIVVFGKTADNCERYLKKGSQVFVEGRLQTQEWQDKTGAKRYTTEIVALNIKFLDRGGEGGPRGGGGGGGGGGFDSGPAGYDDFGPGGGGDAGGGDDDVPF
ncbi:MAG: single-stranded DNA-binding protein [bacterium]